MINSEEKIENLGNTETRIVPPKEAELRLLEHGADWTRQEEVTAF